MKRRVKVWSEFEVWTQRKESLWHVRSQWFLSVDQRHLCQAVSLKLATIVRDATAISEELILPQYCWVLQWIYQTRTLASQETPPMYCFWTASMVHSFREAISQLMKIKSNVEVVTYLFLIKNSSPSSVLALDLTQAGEELSREASVGSQLSPSKRWAKSTADLNATTQLMTKNKKAVMHKSEILESRNYIPISLQRSFRLKKKK